MNRFFHSVTLDQEKCRGCTHCLKRCPTEAIRVRDGKAQIIPERCIDCGECIRVCPYHAKKALHDPLSIALDWKYNIVLPAPSLYGQFNHLDDIDIVLSGLKALGFDEVFEVSKAAELVSEATRQLLADPAVPKPIISSACPAITRLIRVRFPDLCENVLPLMAPVELAAKMAKKAAAERTGYLMKEIGCTFITPCPAKVTDIAVPIGSDYSRVDCAVSMSEVYPLLATKMDKLKTIENLSQSGIIGVSWAGTGGESAALLNEKHLAADGIENCIRVLEELEDDRINEIDFIELSACPSGCVGGVMTVENPYIAKARLQRLRRYLPVACNRLSGDVPREMQWLGPLEFASVLKLSDDMEEALRMLEEIDTCTAGLPGLDCGSCGAPTCRALAEDIVKGLARESDCVFKLRKQLQSVEQALHSIDVCIPGSENETTPGKGDMS